VHVSLYSTIYAYFVSLSIITRIESYLLFVTSSLDISSLVIKSYAIDFHGYKGVFSDLSNP
jgi:hypothetical protein